MRRAEEPEADTTAGVGLRPEVRAAWRVTSVTALPERRLRVSFVDGTGGEVQLSAFLDSPRANGTPFEALRDPAMFAQVSIVLGVVSWPNGADLAPDTMYDAIRAQGTWLVKG